MKAVCLLCLFYLCWPGSVLYAQYVFRSWTTNDGLPQNIVRDVYQTPDGYLWVATLDGLARYDGDSFTVYNTANTPGLISNRLGLVGAPNGDLWIPTESGDLMRYSQGRFEAFGPAQGIRRRAVRGVVAAADGRVWILFDNAVWEWREENRRFLNITPKNLEGPFEALRWDRAGFWTQNGNTLYCFRNGQFISYPLPAQVRGRPLWRVAAAPNEEIWFETDAREQYRISAGKPAVRTAGPKQSSTTIFVDPLGNSWNVRIDEQLDRSLEYSTDEERKVIPFSGFYADRQGNLWIRTEGQGLYQIRKRFIQIYSRKQGLAAANIYPIFQDHTGAI